jgi:hypothetical protein
MLLLALPSQGTYNVCGHFKNGKWYVIKKEIPHFLVLNYPIYYKII